MAEVIDLQFKRTKEEKRLKARAGRRAAAVASALSCGLCPHRCAHCGLAIDQPVTSPPEAPYPFCRDCLEEYEAFRRREGGETKSEAFWHTEEWREMWRLWLEHMRASDAFRRSAAFARLMQEYQE